MMGEVVSETAGMPGYKMKRTLTDMPKRAMKSKVKLKTGNTETPYVGQKVIDGVTYNVNAEGTPVSSIVPVEKKPKTPWEHYDKRMKKGGYRAFKTEEEYNRSRDAFRKKHSKGGAHYSGDGHNH
jgi:antitoxin (DNA-binding transcriptional repressor) of toxin-antitoxin stability system